jgi:predicted transposase/invertase (TIGR01784 family)
MSNAVNNVHDAFFKHVFSDPKLASMFLREHLPPELAELLGSEPPQTIPGSFVDEDLKQHHSDLIFSVPLKNGTPAFAYVLVEHKSTPDRGARLQLMRYIARMLSQWYEQHDKQLPLPPVLPLLVHQGPPDWSESVEFLDLFGPISDLIRPYLPSFRHALVDLAQTDDDTLSGELRLRAFLKALKYNRRPDIADHLYIIFAEAPELDDPDLSAILMYTEQSPVSFNKANLHTVLKNLIPNRKEKIMRWLTQESFDEGLATGIAKGKAEGKAEGRAEAAAALLLHLIRRRWGRVSVKAVREIANADAATLETWFERALDAPTLNSIFTSH